jgi:hypothetical protein
VVSILVAYLVRVGRRDKLVLVGAAIALSVAFGGRLTYTSTTLLQSGASQEAFGGTASLVAVAPDIGSTSFVDPAGTVRRESDNPRRRAESRRMPVDKGIPRKQVLHRRLE